MIGHLQWYFTSKATSFGRIPVPSNFSSKASQLSTPKILLAIARNKAISPPLSLHLLPIRLTRSLIRPITFSAIFETSGIHSPFSKKILQKYEQIFAQPLQIAMRPRIYIPIKNLKQLFPQPTALLKNPLHFLSDPRPILWFST